MIKIILLIEEIPGEQITMEVHQYSRNPTGREKGFAKDMGDVIEKGPQVDGVKHVASMDLPTRKQQEGN
jgi:hypothetical protein